MILYHSSSVDHMPGTILLPRCNYESRWGNCGFYQVLEALRPNRKPSHNRSVFLCLSEEDLDYVGGETDFYFRVKTEGELSIHDMHWSTEITCLIDDLGLSTQDCIRDKSIIDAAKKYWDGVASENPVWEVLVNSAKIISKIE